MLVKVIATGRQYESMFDGTLGGCHLCGRNIEGKEADVYALVYQRFLDKGLPGGPGLAAPYTIEVRRHFLTACGTQPMRKAD